MPEETTTINGGARRITGEEKSYWSVCLGLAAVVILGSAIYYISSYRSEHKKSDPYNFNKPVPTDAELKNRLKEEQYRVTRENGTETPFHNAFWENTVTGIYADIISGEPLFLSYDKWDNSTGQLTFTQPISYDLLVEKQDLSHDMVRVEVRAKRSDAHLGHLFGDPTSPTGRRYSLNSAAFQLIPVDKLQEMGYEQYRPLLNR